MMKPNPRLQQLAEGLSTQSLFQLTLKAAFIALVAFGGPAGALAALFPRAFFGLAAPVVCPRGSDMRFDQWFDGESNQIRMFCVDRVSAAEDDRTISALLVWMGVFFLLFFYITLVVLLILRARNRNQP